MKTILQLSSRQAGAGRNNSALSPVKLCGDLEPKPSRRGIQRRAPHNPRPPTPTPAALLAGLGSALSGVTPRALRWGTLSKSWFGPRVVTSVAHASTH